MRYLAALPFCLATLSVEAAHTQARLVLAQDVARPGDTVMAGVYLRMDPRWHTYWRNSGASGSPTKLDWQLPKGVSAGATLWPVPEKLPPDDLTTYIYKDEVMLLVPLKLAADLAPGPLQLKAKVSWLECDLQCVPGSANLQATLNVGGESKPSGDATFIAGWQKKLPQNGAGLSARARWEKGATGDTRPLILEWSSPTAASEADFFPDGSEDFELQGATERVPTDAGKLAIRKQVKKFSGDWPARISGVVLQQSGTNRLAYEAAASVESGLAAPPLWVLVLSAFVGGLILNIMPCVLPVIALKILGFVGQARDDPRRVRKLGLVYALGVLVSFLAFAILVIALRAGWGLQFQNAQFVVFLVTLVTLVALNLFGLFEVNLSGRAMGAAGALASRHGTAGAFFNGVLATVLATPCTAPILATGVGFAAAYGPAGIFLIWLTVGVGLAAPYVLLSWQPAWLRFLPKPGPWMERFKKAMGFPMLATAGWLFSLVPIFYGDRAWWLLVFLVIVALAAWVFGEFVQRGRARRGLALVVTLALLLGGYVWVVEGRLRWRSVETADPAAPAGTPERAQPGGVAWQPWSPEAVAAARAQGRPVLVDFTARWCLTCNTIVKPALESKRVRDLLEQTHTVALLGDYTRFPPNITEELNRFGRAGVPLVLVYPKNTNEPPMVFDLVTSSTAAEALERAAK